MTSTTKKSNQDRFKILSEWKKLYSEALIKELHPTGDVLEIGFGMGAAADQIQKLHPKTHTIIEQNPTLVEEAKKWASQKKNITILQGSWDKILPKLGKFDTVFFNDCSDENDMAIMNFLFPEDLLKSSAEAKKLLGDLQEQMSQLTMEFSDQDIEDFYNKVGKSNLSEMPQFFLKLRDNKNISKTQYENAVKKYHLSKIPEASDNKKPDLPTNPNIMLRCLEECLKHMNKNGRFSSFLCNQFSKYEDSQFFDNIITNPDFDYKETSVKITTTDRPRDGLMILVEKSS